ncbi:transcobalamin-2 [Eucyclogobius newberryi]|uniref:transcobalamin-2 n=1 Tax=Eucyclogobius newberryi TaxID=166745 RepID=UPI003B5A4C9D
MILLLILSVLTALTNAEPCNTRLNNELLVSLNKALLRSVESQEGLPNPSVHLALRLSDQHNQAQESAHLLRLTSLLHGHIQSSLSQTQSSPGLLALYALALKSSCYDLSTITFTVKGHTVTLLNQLKNTMQKEKEEITVNQHTRPSTNYYHYSLGVLGLCVGGVRVEHHVLHHLLKAVEQEHLNHGAAVCVDSYAMAGMALQCVKDSRAHVLNTHALNTALTKIQQKLLAARRPDGHIGNEFSTGLAVQALLAMGQQLSECSVSLEAMRTDARNSLYHNPMALSQILPALQLRSYVSTRTKQCLSEDDSLALEPPQPVIEAPVRPKVSVSVAVQSSEGAENTYSVDVPQGSSLLQTLELLATRGAAFTFEKESSLWGPFLSVVNGEQARQSDRRYWQLSAEGTALTQGIRDYKIETPQKIVIKNMSY